MFVFVNPWFSIENVCLNYIMYNFMVVLLAVVLVIVISSTIGLGPVIGGFFAPKQEQIEKDKKEESSTDGKNKSKIKIAKALDTSAEVDGSGGNTSSTSTNSSSDEAADTASDLKNKNTLFAKESAEGKSGEISPPSPGKGKVEMKIMKQQSQALDASDIEFLEKLLKKHGPNDFDAWVCLAITAFYGIASVYLIHNYPSWWSVTLNAMFQVRGFIVFHDACHKSFFTSSKQNAQCAFAFSTFIPMNASDWSKSHNHHHQHLGRHDISDFSLTVWFSEKEYESMTPPLKWSYRLIRDPFILPNLLSVFVFWVFPYVANFQKTFYTRGIFYFPFLAVCGYQTVLLYLLASWIAGMIGLQLFHLQHQCNTPYRVEGKGEHSKYDAGMLGSTHLLVPFPLTEMTMGIEYHHIHHASTQVPGYHLRACHEEGALRKQKGSESADSKSGTNKSDGEGETFWDRAGVNKVGPKRAFLSLFHTVFEGDTKFAHQHDHGTLPRFRSFDFYRWLGLEDLEGNDTILVRM